MKNKKISKTECLFAINGNVCTRSNVIDKEGCSTKTLLKGFTKCVYLYPEEKAKEINKNISFT